jgi:hypothetical protein
MAIQTHSSCLSFSRAFLTGSKNGKPEKGGGGGGGPLPITALAIVTPMMTSSIFNHSSEVFLIKSVWASGI